MIRIFDHVLKDSCYFLGNVSNLEWSSEMIEHNCRIFLRERTWTFRKTESKFECWSEKLIAIHQCNRCDHGQEQEEFGIISSNVGYQIQIRAPEGVIFAGSQTRQTWKWWTDGRCTPWYIWSLHCSIFSQIFQVSTVLCYWKYFLSLPGSLSWFLMSRIMLWGSNNPKTFSTTQQPKFMKWWALSCIGSRKRDRSSWSPGSVVCGKQ